MSTARVVCVDVGSTFTKAAVVDVTTGALAGTAARPTTVDSDVLCGLDAAVAAAGGTGLPVYGCSSAGGGLRLAVVGYESLVTAQAGARVGLCAGARVVHVAAGRLDRAAVRALRDARPDVLLLVGGTDGGDADTLLHNGRMLAGIRWPVVLAGNAEARAGVLAVLPAAVPTENVLPRLGVLNPEPARSAIREVFLRHVIGGKRLSRGPRFGRLVRGATPDVVLDGISELGGEVAVVDIGGATTDVYSVRAPRDGGRSRSAAGTAWRSRTVEGDLGMRWGAAGVGAAAQAERLLAPDERDRLAAAAARRVADVGLLPDTAGEHAIDLRLAQLAATVALRRHARSGADLRDVRLVIGSGGVLRQHGEQGAAVLAAALADHAGGWALPRDARVVVDADYVLAPAGLLAAEYPAAARALLRSRLPSVE